MFQLFVWDLRFLTASVNSGPSNTFVVVVVGDFPPKLLENAYTGGQNAKRIFALSFNLLGT